MILLIWLTFFRNIFASPVMLRHWKQRGIQRQPGSLSRVVLWDPRDLVISPHFSLVHSHNKMVMKRTVLGLFLL